MFNRDQEKKEPDVGSFSEFDLQLQKDKDGSFRKNIVKQLEEKLTQVKMKLQAGGLKPNDFELAEKATKGLEDAINIVNKATSTSKP